MPVSEIAHAETATYRWQAYKRDGSTAAARGFKKAFVQGFIIRLAERLEETQRDVVNESGSTALIRINKMQKDLDDFMKKQEVHMGLSRVREALHPEGRRRGQAAADRINLGTKAVNGNQVKELK